MFKPIVCILIFIKFSLSGSAQDIYSDHINISYNSGVLITHRESIDQSLRGLDPWGIQLSYSKRSDGSKPWHKLWNGAHHGISFSYYNMVDTEVLGSVYSVGIFFEKHLELPLRNLHLSYRISPGLSYNDRTYDEMLNPLNLFISSPLNFAFETNLLFHYRLTQSIGIFLGPQMSHYSNAAMKFPNIGINIPAVKFGLSYLHSDPQEFEISSGIDFNQKCFYLLKFNVSLNSAGQEYEELDLAYLISMEGIWNIHPRFSLISSLDLIRSNASRKVLKNEKANRHRLGLAIGGQLEWGRLSFLLQYGLYVFRPEKDLYKSTYSRLGLSYRLNERLYFNAGLRSHLFKAELAEWGIAVLLFRNRSFN